MKQHFLILYSPGPAWKKDHGIGGEDLMAHGDYMHSLHQQNILIEGGPFMDDSGGMTLITVDDKAQAESIVAKDPAVINGVFTAVLRPWMRVNWETYQPSTTSDS